MLCHPICNWLYRGRKRCRYAVYFHAQTYENAITNTHPHTHTRWSIRVFSEYWVYGTFRYALGWLRLVGSFKLWVSIAKEPYEIDDNLQKRPIILRSLQLVATPCVFPHTNTEWHTQWHTHTQKMEHTRFLKTLSAWEIQICCRFRHVVDSDML